MVHGLLFLKKIMFLLNYMYNTLFCIHRFPFKRIGDRYGFGIKGEWQSEYMAGEGCSFYSTINGVEVYFRCLTIFQLHVLSNCESLCWKEEGGRSIFFSTVFKFKSAFISSIFKVIPNCSLKLFLSHCINY